MLTALRMAERMTASLVFASSEYCYPSQLPEKWTNMTTRL